MNDEQLMDLQLEQEDMIDEAEENGEIVWLDDLTLEEQADLTIKARENNYPEVSRGKKVGYWIINQDDYYYE